MGTGIGMDSDLLMERTVTTRMILLIKGKVHGKEMKILENHERGEE